MILYRIKGPWWIYPKQMKHPNRTVRAQFSKEEKKNKDILFIVIKLLIYFILYKFLTFMRI
jgi:hypothetical protein